MSINPSHVLTTELRRAEAELVEVRDDLVRSVRAAESEVTHALDWRAWIRRKPILFLGAALALGLLVGRRD